MKKIVLSALAIASLASCSSTPLEKASLEYKVFPKVANYKYDFNLAIPQPVDARVSKFILNNDGYFEQGITESVSNILFDEIRASNSFNTVAVLNNEINFNPTSTAIQEVRRTVGKDAILLTQINKFNANVRKLSDLDASSFVNLTVFTNITYKLLLVDSETVVFLTTKDTSASKVVSLDDNFYKTVNELAQKSVKENIVSAKNDFLIATKSAVDGGASQVKQKKPLEVAKEFDRVEAEKAAALAKEQEELAKLEQPKATEEKTAELAQAQTTQTATPETQELAQEATQETAPKAEAIEAEIAETNTQVAEAPVEETPAPAETVVEETTTVEATPATETVETTKTVEAVETTEQATTTTTPAVDQTVEQVVETTPAN
jgi:hypothetical protein